MARRSLDEDTDTLSSIQRYIGYIDAFGANLGIILEKCYLSIYQLLNA
jgi:hypothetical protein